MRPLLARPPVDPLWQQVSVAVVPGVLLHHVQKQLNSGRHRPKTYGESARVRVVTRWGIVGTGGIASTFAADLELLDDAEVVAVGSRSQEKADEFGNRFSIPHRHASYEALAEDPDVE